MKVRLDIDGIAPLLMHNIRLADPLDPIVRDMKLISGKRKKTDDDLMELAHLEFIGGLYISSELGPYVKGAAIRKSFVEGGRVTKQGKQIERGLQILDLEAPLVYAGPRDAESLWADVNFRSREAVKVGTARVHRTRPIFRTWSVSVEADMDTALLNIDTLQAIASDAGTMAGLGDYRPTYGRYAVQVVKI